MAGRAHSRFPSSAASQPAFPYVATDADFPTSANFSTGIQLPCPPLSLGIDDQYPMPQAYFDPESGSLMSFQPAFSYVSDLPHCSGISGLTATACSSDFPTGADFLALQDDLHARSGSYSPETLVSHTSSPSLHFRRRTSNVPALQLSPSASPSHMPSPYLTSPTESTSMTSPQPSLHPTLAHRPSRSKGADADRQPAASPRKKRRSGPPTPASASPSPPRASSSSSAAAARDMDRERLSPADALLVQLREDEGLAWRDVAARFRAETGRDFSVAALQMRLKRLRERARPWTEHDVAALRRAHDYWISHKFDIIAAKMMDFGVAEGWTGRQCARKLQQMGFPTSPIEEK